MELKAQIKGTNALVETLKAQASPAKRRVMFKTWGILVTNAAKKCAMKKKRSARTNFWGRVAASIRMRNVGPDVTDVYANEPGALFREYGGVIQAKNVKFLAIPVDKIALGKSPADNAILNKKPFWVPRKGKAPLLCTFKGKELRPLFVLARRVKQKATPWWVSPRTVDSLGVYAIKKVMRKGGES